MGSRGVSRGVGLITVVFGLALAIGVSCPSTAYADGVFVFNTHTPVAPGGTTTAAAVSVGVRADSTAAFPVADPYYQITLDGVVQTITAEQLGHWVDDGCSTWWVVDDPTVLTLYTPYVTLADGAHTVTARFKDSLGAVDETTWTFITAAPPGISNNSPTIATSSTQPLIQAKVSDNGTVAPRVMMWVDGSLVASSLAWTPASGTGIVSYTPSVPLTDLANHSVQIHVIDP